ncbi:MAG: hypothetical protein D6798_08240 [Deltaproteobacteria bacterium]|nr:MAG: hypothetical protein D6798_08240 [Deltaproteobacteria bacterium]
MISSATRTLPLIAVLTACATDPEPPLEPSEAPAEVAAVWAAIQPESLVDLTEDPGRIVPVGLTCPVIDAVDGVETWTGGCAMLDGTVIDGVLLRYADADQSWVEGRGFTVWDHGEPTLVLDGAVELTRDGDLLHLDAAATTCGLGTDCADGPVRLDLRFSLLPTDDGLRSYDAVLRGIVALDDGEPAPVEGAWRVDRDVCAQEPMDGIFAVQLDERHTVALDGASACDACGERTVQGVDAPPWCDGGA